MEPKQLIEVILILVNSQKYSQAQTYELLGRFCSGITGSPTSGGPALAADRLSPKDNPDSEQSSYIIIPYGKQFNCTKCGKMTLETISDVMSTMKTSLFRACFNPELSKDNGVWADAEGNAAVDCPDCNAKKTVWIMGRVGQTFAEVPEGDNGGF